MTHEARALYLELAMLSHGACQAFNPAGGAGVPDSRPPSGESHPPHELFAEDFARRGQGAVKHWREVLREWRGEGRVRPVGKSDREIVLEAGEGYSPDDVSRRYRCTPTMVRKWRREAGVNEETGTGESIVARAKRLRDEGVSVRRIASEVGTHPTQVQRWTREAA
jgi:transposase-like protein